MAEKKYVRNSIDFDALRASIMRAEPEKMTVEQIVGELAEPIMAAVERGVPLSVIRDNFKAQKITVTLRDLRELVQGRSRAPASGKSPSGEESLAGESRPRGQEQEKGDRGVGLDPLG